MNYSKRLIALAVCIQITTSLAATQKIEDKALRHLLAEQGFTGVLTGKVQLRPIGTFHCNAMNLQVFDYTSQQSNPPGAAVHGTERLLFLRNNGQYLGSYAVDDRPTKITGASIVFNYPKSLGNAIQCHHQGLPKSVLLNGDLGTLEK